MTHIIFVGIQGSGKGTQARKILEKHSKCHFFEMGQRLREFADGDEPLSAQVKKSLQGGNMISDTIIRTILETYAKKYTDAPIIFDGIPRSLSQVKLFDEVFSDYCIIFLDLDKETAMERLANRRIDPKTGQSFPADFQGEYSPFTGTKLVMRSDDHEEAVIKRIEVFYNNTLPLIAEWAAREKRVFRIDAKKTIDEVSAMIDIIVSAYL